MNYIFIIVALFVFELIYFSIANRFNIIDKPNERSSHSEITIRGGGIIFYIAILLFFILNDFQYPLFVLGLTAVAVLSLLDDILTLSSKIRLPIQFLSVGLMLYQVLGNQWLLLVIGLIIATGILNAYNFMDGINGITGIYSLSVLLSLAYLNLEIEFIDFNFLYYSILGVVVFNFFNVRKKAKCFAGDVGSVSIAMIVMFSLLQLINATGNLVYILFLAVYGIDSILTIIHRLTKKENIFEAHRSHLYQWLVKPGPFSQLQMAMFYGLSQLLINVLVIQSANASLIFQLSISSAIIIVLLIVYIVVKLKYIKKYNLV